ncbi:MAG: hypothetical protein IJD17_03195 [Clostridia bacterium]|nr:hypothetical protein [Clostridia bacterium]
MMWDNIAEKVEGAAKVVGSEAAKLADTAKTKYNIAVREGRLEKIFESIGELYYDQLKNDTDNSKKIAKLVAKADEVKDELDRLGK